MRKKIFIVSDGDHHSLGQIDTLNAIFVLSIKSYFALIKNKLLLLMSVNEKKN